MYPQLEQIHEGGGSLRAVNGVFWHSENESELPVFVALSLVFEEGEVLVAVEEDDSLFIGDEKMLRTDPATRSVALSAMAPWNGAIGLPLLWSWTLTNQQGYVDGLQLEFAANVESPSVLIQLLAVAGEIKVRQIPPSFMATIY
ncbi:MAG: DUF6334 family protein [Proteobacteria bacterium]|nr:DUF6334 family protein [Pseudomonadota bacterium]